MPKNNRKKNKNKLRVPPLSALDKVVYLLLGVLGIAVSLGLLFGTYALADRIAFADPAVLVTESKMSFFVLPLVFLPCVGWLATLAFRYRIGQPIFGQSDIVYGPAGGYIDVYPLFGKQKRSVKPPRPEENQKSGGTRKILLMIVIPFLLLPLTLFGRYDLREDMTVTVCNIVNMETARFELEDVETVTFAIDHYKAGRRTWLERTQVTLQMKNGRKYRFTADADTLLYVKSQFPRSSVQFELDVSVEEYIQKKHLDEDEAAKVREVFDQ